MNETQSILPILRHIPLFGQLTEESHQAIIQKITLELYPSGHVIFHEGDEANKLYILKRGMVKVSKNNAEGVDEEVAVLAQNDFFGEMALITDEKRNATITTLEETEVFVLAKSDFLVLVADVPDMANKISTEFVSRLKHNNK